MIDKVQSLTSHIPVLLNEVIRWLRPELGGQFLDCTFGGGGHSRAFLSAGEKIFVYAIDRDPAAKDRAREFSLRYPNFRFYQMNFSETGNLQLPPLNGILMDLGVSSFQLSDDSRGFSFRGHALLDMRMDNSKGMMAGEFLCTADEQDLVIAVRDYGEEKQWKKIVQAILKNRGIKDLRYADVFARLVSSCIPAGEPRHVHPATKTFQGIRIFINDELHALEMALPVMFDKLTKGGRLAVISFHSLEDRIVKRFFNQMAGKAVDKFDSSYQQDRIVYGNILTKKPDTPDESEINNNPSARSAKLRVLEKTCSTTEAT
jgi:16S rRNA (cytosine1402-N4)-methyltransferase